MKLYNNIKWHFYLEILKYHKGHLKYSELVCVGPLLCAAAAELTCSVAAQAAMSSSAPRLIYSQTLIGHVPVNTLWCTSFTLRPHVHTNTFTIGALHLTAAFARRSLCLFLFTQARNLSSKFKFKFNLARTDFNTFSRNFCFLSISIISIVYLLVKPDKCGEFHTARNIWRTFPQKCCLVLLFT